jgi:hypothetical protein
VLVPDRREQPRGHLLRWHPQFRVHARDDEVELRQEVLLLVEGAVVEDVDLDAVQQPERLHELVGLRDDLPLRPQPVG